MRKIIDQFTASKTGDEAENEDGYIITDTVIAVFDGATDKRISQLASSDTPGRVAMLALSAAAEQIGVDATPVQIAEALHLAVREAKEDMETEDADGCVAAGAVAHLPTRTVVRVGDISVGRDGDFDIPHKVVDLVAGDVRAKMLREALAEGVPQKELQECDPGRDFVVEWLRGSRILRNQNRSLGFAVLDGTATPPAMIDKVSLDGVGELVLASDGYVSPRPTLEESEKELEDLICRDPLRIEEPPGTKGIAPGNVSFDDRAYVRVRLG